MLCVGIIVLLSFLQLAEPRSVVGEPQCSPYDFFERTLDKVIRVEHETELFKDKVDKMEDTLRDRLEDMEGNIDKRFALRDSTSKKELLTIIGMISFILY